jgi:hypothetical protein
LALDLTRFLRTTPDAADRDWARTLLERFRPHDRSIVEHER